MVALAIINIFFFASVAFATEIRTYVVNTSSVTDITILTSRGMKGKDQYILNTKVVPIDGSKSCQKMEIAYRDTGEKSYLESLEADGSMVLIGVDNLTTTVDPRGGELTTVRDTRQVSKIPSYCFEVAVSSK